ncbi:MAG: calcineurin-like phosphoesterase C-terminal domain-containing protein [Bacteroidales bacterium]|nr:calcineurin-like phosphoesterase C-terminal domain-containing protein [Bacteroidales bacterium]
MRITTLSFILLLAVVSCNINQDKPSGSLPYSIKAGPGENQARGVVFHDKNENMVLDASEKGIEGVAVSNGTNLVQTNNKGEYELPVSDDAIIFVIKPKDWITPVNSNNLPQFYYLHKPNGYPGNFNYKGVAPTGELPEQINFPLYSEKGSKQFKMVVFGDPQPYNIEQVDFLAEDVIVELIGRKDLEFGMTMGDIVGDDLDLFSPLNQAVSKIGIPWYNVLGNHDINYMAPNDRLSDETYERVYGPATYAFVYGDVHFIVIDDVIHEDSVGSWQYVGGLRPDQFAFVSNYLKIVPKEDLVVLTMHIPLAQHGETFRKSDQKKLFDLLKEFPHTLSISAHTHVHDNQFFHEGSSDWQQATPHHHFNVGTTSGSWWNGMRSETDVPHTMMRDGTPNGYSFISFKGTDYIIDWKVAGSPSDHQMNIHVPRGIVAGSPDTVLLTVNFFNGSEQSILEYRILELTDWQKMDKVDKYDPYYQMIDQRWKNLNKLNIKEHWKSDTTLADQTFPGTDMPQPRKSTHLWEANLGTDWPEGRHIIEVKANDRYGRTFIAYHTMRVVEND